MMQKNRTLYLGLELPTEWQGSDVFHYPIIRIVSRANTDRSIQSAFKHFDRYTHLIFTSKSAIPIFLDLLRVFKINISDISNKTIIAVGKKTSARLKEHGIDADWIAAEESSEGIVALLQTRIDSLREGAHVLIPQSALARPILREWMETQNIPCTICPIYDTVFNLVQPLPELKEFQEIVFTSPSTINAFLQAYGSLPANKTLHSIGPVTQERLNQLLGSGSGSESGFGL